MKTMNKQDILILKASAKSISYFVHEICKAEPSAQQQAVLDAIDRGEKKLSIRSGHGTGKTALLSWIVIWWGLFKEDAKIPMTAPTSHQLFDLLLPEIRKWRDRLPDVLKSEFEVGAERVVFNNGNFAVARTARKEQPEALQGFHAGALAFIIDEASGIPQIIFEVAEGAMTGEDVLVVMAANPTRTEGYFYDSHNKNRWQWTCFQFNAETSPNVSKKWVEEKKRQYGEDSDTYRIRVKGDFPLKSSDSIMSLAEIENAVNATVWDDTGVEVWGVDVADFGDDKTVLAKRRNKYFYPLQTKSGLNITEIAGWLVKEYRDSIVKPYAIFVDAIGVGSSLAPICHQLGLDCVIPVKASNRASDDEKYHNRRAEWYFRLKDILLDGKLPDDDELVGELMAQRYKISPQGKLIVIPKDEIKKELGRSPDKADACSLTCHDILYGFVQEDDFIEAEIISESNPFGASGGIW